jgi:hypothetical protein
MTLNQHNYDRIVRVILAIALFAGTAITGIWLLAVVGAILLVTAVVGFCPIYAIFGMSTKPKDKSEV